MKKTRIILLLEDDDNDVLLVHRALSQMVCPCHVERVCDGEQAIEYLTRMDSESSEHTPALVLCDMHMSRSDGFSFLQWFRASEKFEKLPVIILSGSSRGHDLQTALSLGANAFLSKDFLAENPKRFAQTIDRILEENIPFETTGKEAACLSGSTRT